MTQERDPVQLQRTLEDHVTFANETLNYEIRRAPVLERDWRLIVLLIVLAIGGPAIGLVLPGIAGFGVGVVVGVVATLVGLRALTKVVRIERG